jgi:hypothetical protein
VFVIDWTLMGAPPPTVTLPTRTARLGRRGAGPALHWLMGLFLGLVVAHT